MRGSATLPVQGVHVIEPLPAAKVPRGQGRGTTRPSGQNVPGGQSSEASSSFPFGQYLPALQGVHSALPSSLYVPGRQGCDARVQAAKERECLEVDLTPLQTTCCYGGRAKGRFSPALCKTPSDRSVQQDSACPLHCRLEWLCQSLRNKRIPPRILQSLDSQNRHSPVDRDCSRLYFSLQD